MASPANRTLTLIGSDTTAHTIDIVSPSAGDGILIVGAIDGAVTITDWDGATELDVTSNQATLAIGWLKATGSEGATLSLVTSGSQKGIWRVYQFTSGITDWAVTPPEIGTAATGASTSPDPPSLTPTGGSDSYWWLAAEGHDGSALSTGFPTSYSSTDSTASGGGAGQAVLSTGERSNAGTSEDPDAFTMTSESWVANTVAVYPAAGGGGGGVGVAFDDDVTLYVEAAFGYGVYETSPSWTDITEYVRNFTTTRGRQFAGDPTQTGTASMTLDNADGRFDPTYTSGAYYPDIVPMVRIRIRAEYDVPLAIELDDPTTGKVFGAGGGTGSLQCGEVGVVSMYAASWPQTWPQHTDAEVTVELVDAWKLFNLNYLDVSVGVYREGLLMGIESTGPRLGHILDRLGWPTEWRHIPVGTLLQPAKDYTSTGLAGLREVVQLEDGMIHIDTEGRFEFQPQSVRANWDPEAAPIFGDDIAGGVEAPYTDLRLGFDDDQIWNRFEIGNEVTAGVLGQIREDATSKARYGTRVIRQTFPADAGGNTGYTDTGVAALRAARGVFVYKDAVVRVDALTFQPRGDHAAFLWPLALGIEVGNPVTVRRRPPAGNTVVVNGFVEGIQHTVDAATRMWETTWLVSTLETFS